MQYFEPESFKRSHSTTKTIHNLRPSILSRSVSQSIMSPNQKFNRLLQSTDQKMQKLSPVKVNFTFNQLSNQASKYTQKYNKAEKLQDPTKQSRKEKKTFLNVISKESVPDQIIKFVYGNQQSNLSKNIIPTSAQKTSTQTLQICKPHPFNPSNQQTESKQQIEEIISPLIDNSFFESFPSSKLKKSRNSSALKSTEKKVQLPNNYKIQINNKINSLTQDLLNQEGKQYDAFERNNLQNQLQFQSTRRQTALQQNEKKETSQRLILNDTIKLKSFFSQSHNQKNEITKTQSTANQSLQPFSISQNDGKGNLKNQTQKISEFLLCDEQVVPTPGKINQSQYQYDAQKIQQQHNKQKMIKKDRQKLTQKSKIFKKADVLYIKDKNAISQVPIFEIKLEDLKDFPGQQLFKNGIQDQTIQSQQKLNHEGINFLNDKIEPIQQCDKLHENLNVLGINIQDLAKTIQRFPSSNEFFDSGEKTSLHQKERSVESQVKIVGQKIKVKQSSVPQQKMIQITIKVEKDKIFQKRNSQKHQYKITQKNAQVKNIAQKSNPYVNEFIPCEQEQTNRQQYQNFYLPKLSTNQVQNISIPQNNLNHNNELKINTDIATNISFKVKQKQHVSTLQDSQNQPNAKVGHRNNRIMGSLQVVEDYCQANALSNSLRNIYSIPQNSVQLSPETCKNVQNPDKILTNFKFPESLFPQNSQLQTNIEKKALDKTNLKLYPNHLNLNSSRQYSKGIPQFQKSYKKRNTFNQNSRTSNPSIKSSAQRKITNLIKFSSVSKTKMFKLSDPQQKGSQNLNQQEKRQLNYEMYKKIRTKSKTKYYTQFVINQSKSRVIELPLMQTPVQIDGSKLIYPKYIKNKVYYVKG